MVILYDLQNVDNKSKTACTDFLFIWKKIHTCVDAYITYLVGFCDEWQDIFIQIYTLYMNLVNSKLMYSFL